MFELVSPNLPAASQNKGLVHLTERLQCLDTNDMGRGNQRFHLIQKSQCLS